MSCLGAGLMAPFGNKRTYYARELANEIMRLAPHAWCETGASGGRSCDTTVYFPSRLSNDADCLAIRIEVKSSKENMYPLVDRDALQWEAYHKLWTEKYVHTWYAFRCVGRRFNEKGWFFRAVDSLPRTSRAENRYVDVNGERLESWVRREIPVPKE